MNFRRFIKNKYVIIITAVIVIGGVIAVGRARNTATQGGEVSGARVKQVRVATVAALNSTLEPLPVLGTVEARQEAEVRAETGGEVTAVYGEEGSYVGAGQMLIELKNASQRAAVLQAEGAVAAAEAALAKARKGTRDEQLAILAAQEESARTSLEDARVAARNAVRDAYMAADNAIHNQTDELFVDPRSPNPQLIFLAANVQVESDVRWQRQQLAPVLRAWAQRATGTLAPAEIGAALNEAEHNLTVLRDYLDNMAILVNARSTSEPSWKATVSAARTGVSGALSGVVNARAALNARAAALAVAEEQRQQGIRGAEDEDILGLEAQVMQAQGLRAAAQAELEKTRVRAPFAGTLNVFTIKRGDYVAFGAPVATVANNAGLEIKTYVSESDQTALRVGAAALIEGKWQGRITRIAPALDPFTQKIAVLVVPASGALLTPGQSVRLALDRIVEARDDQLLTVPITAISVNAHGSSVFTVAEDGTLAAHLVVTGSLLGENVIVREGLEAETAIVIDVRGLKEGDEVEIIEGTR